MPTLESRLVSSITPDPNQPHKHFPKLACGCSVNDPCLLDGSSTSVSVGPTRARWGCPTPPFWGLAAEPEKGAF
jgi:hypothetical protein